MISEDIAALAAAVVALKAEDPPANNPPTINVSAVSLKLATFWAADPVVWFAQTEAQFASRNPPVTVDSTKFNHVAAALDNNTASEVRSIILNPPANNKYDALKVALIRAFGKSQAQKDRDLLNLNGLGDRRPTALLRHINSLNADPATLKRALFLAQLPVEVRRVLAASTTTDLEDLAIEADKIVEAGTLATTQVSSLAVLPRVLPTKICATSTSDSGKRPGAVDATSVPFHTWCRRPHPQLRETLPPAARRFSGRQILNAYSLINPFTERFQDSFECREINDCLGPAGRDNFPRRLRRVTLSSVTESRINK